MNVSIMAYLDRTKIPVSIDIGFGDVVYPERVKMEFPVLLDMEAPEIYAYSISSVISKKPSKKPSSTEKRDLMIYLLSRMAS